MQKELAEKDIEQIDRQIASAFYFEIEEDKNLDTSHGTPNPCLDLLGIRRLALETQIEVGEPFRLSAEGDVPKKG